MEQVSVWRISRCLGLQFSTGWQENCLVNENKQNKGEKSKKNRRYRASRIHVYVQ